MSLLSRRRALLMRLQKFLRTIISAPPVSCPACVDDSVVDYKIYGNSFQDGAPTPDAPIVVESVGEKTINLYQPKKDKLVGAYSGFDMSGWEHTYYTLQVRLKEGKTTPSGVYFGFLYSNTQANWLVQNGEINTSIYGNPPTHTINMSELNGVCCYPIDKLDAFIDAFDVMLVKGNYSSKTIPAYEPYGYKIPVVARGKNLFNPTPTSTQWQVTTTILDYNKIQQTGKSTTNPNGYSQFMVHLKPGKYSVSVNLKTNGTGTTAPTLNVWGAANAGNTVKVFALNNNSITSGSFTITEEKDYYIALYGRCYENETAFFQVQIEYGNTTTDFEPYLGETYTTNIYLNEPLRKAGTVADYVDFANSKVVRNIKRTELTKAGDKYNYLSKKGVCFYRCLDDNYFVNTNAVSNRENKFTQATGNITALWLGVNGNVVYWIGILDYLGFETVDEFNTWLAENPTYIYYASTHPTEELMELPQLPTLEGTTVYTINTELLPSNMEVTYYSKESE